MKNAKNISHVEQPETLTLTLPSSPATAKRLSLNGENAMSKTLKLVSMYLRSSCLPVYIMNIILSLLQNKFDNVI